MLMGMNRARYFMLTGQQLDAQTCLDWGLFNEVLPRDQVLSRAYEHARMLLEGPPATVRLFRPAVLQQVKQLMLDSVSHGLMMEGMAWGSHWPQNPINVPSTPYDDE